jgi:hypothetical protein
MRRGLKVLDPTREDLAVEAYGVLGAALKGLGLPRVAYQRAMRRARQLPNAPSVSGPLLRNLWGLSELLRAWSREARFRDASGRPRVLLIAGPGATFQSLAKRLLPGMPLAEVLGLACASAQVAVRPGGKIALIGGVLVNYAHSPELILAYAIRHLDQLLTAMLHDATARKNGAPEWRRERMLSGLITRAQFDDLMQELTPVIDDFMRRIERTVQARRPTSRQAMKNSTAVSVGLYVAREDDVERAGMDSAARGMPGARGHDQRK